MLHDRVRAASLGLLATLACAPNDEDGASTPDTHVADAAPLSRMTTEQYTNTVRDLLAPAQVGQLLFPAALEGRGGFENNAAFNTPSPALVEAYQRAAATVADDAIAQLDLVLGCDRSAEGCVEGWLPSFAERAWRRPLTEGELEILQSQLDQWRSSYDVDTAVGLTIQYLLQSPDFLYFPRFGNESVDAEEGAVPLSQWELAARLSYFLWDSMPDAELFALAREGRLGERQAVADQAFRMLSDGRAVDMVVDFHRQNWDFDEVGANPIDLDFYAPVFEERGLVEEDEKSDYYYLEYSPGARFESDVFVARHIFWGDARLETLLTSNRTWATPDVAAVAYQHPIDDSAEPVSWQDNVPLEGNDEIGIYEGEYYPLELDPSRRAGIFTMVGFLIAKAGPQHPAPVRRGVTIIERLLCTELVPPGDVPPLENVETMEPKTNREKYALHSQSAACAGCHRSIDGIGLTFEHYDSMGRWRDTDNGFPVDASGELVGTDRDGEVSDAVALMKEMGQSRTVHDCYTRQWFRYAFGRNETAEDEPVIEALQEGFWGSGGNVLELVVNIAASYSFRHRRAQ